MSQTSHEETPKPDTAISDPLVELTRIIDRAVEFAQRWDPTYRPHIFGMAVGQLMSSYHRTPSHVTAVVPSPAASDAGDLGPPRDHLGATAKLARVINANAAMVERVVQIDGDGTVRIIGRLEGSTKRGLQTHYTLVYCFIKEVGIGERDVDIEELRVLCIDQACYDGPNFTANFRKAFKEGLLLEVGGKIGRIKRLRASKKGLDEAALVFRKMAEG